MGVHVHFPVFLLIYIIHVVFSDRQWMDILGYENPNILSRGPFQPCLFCHPFLFSSLTWIYGRYKGALPWQFNVISCLCILQVSKFLAHLGKSGKTTRFKFKSHLVHSVNPVLRNARILTCFNLCGNDRGSNFQSFVESVGVAGNWEFDHDMIFARSSTGIASAWCHIAAVPLALSFTLAIFTIRFTIPAQAGQPVVVPVLLSYL